MLTTLTNTGSPVTRSNNAIHEPRKRRDAANQERGDGAPVGGEFGRVAVDAVEVVHVWYGDVTASDDEVAAAGLG